LAAEEPDLHMAGTVASQEMEIAAVLLRAVPVPVETCEGSYPLIPGLPNPYADIPPLSVSHPHNRGSLRVGMNTSVSPSSAIGVERRSILPATGWH
jgi:hypothetical protein